ncbi:MAG TPA: glycosyltransferase family 4 protein [Aggregatilineales bacterium]|nr:glycosyltransferase family 4 protein [Aggregatilineales bacterium]
MRIAQVAPLYESVPPRFYGGTERIVAFLTEELVRQGHEVTLFASGDSETSATLVPICPKALRMTERVEDDVAYYTVMLEKVFQMADDFDLIHFHSGYQHFPLARIHQRPNLTTLHGRLDLPGLVPLFEEYTDMPVVSISDSQRRPLPDANWQGTIYHGLPLDAYTFHPEPGSYLAFLGRLSPEKRVDRAIEIAKRLDMDLHIAAKINWFEREYFETKIQPLMDHPRIHFHGEISEEEKNEFLGNAATLLFPIDWPEPFGLVMIEAMACGTPVVAFRQGAVPEVVDHGRSGFVVNTIEEAVQAVEDALQLDRALVRQMFEERWTVSRMAEDYVATYERVLEHWPVLTP